MKCPFCGYTESKVVDSRPTDEGSSIRRRRECLSCGSRFTTYETVEYLPVIVVKKDGSREAFDRSKLLGGLVKACEKRPVPLALLEKAVADIILHKGADKKGWNKKSDTELGSLEDITDEIFQKQLIQIDTLKVLKDIKDNLK